MCVNCDENRSYLETVESLLDEEDLLTGARAPWMRRSSWVAVVQEEFVAGRSPEAAADRLARYAGL